jgi:hypothetical protein
MTEREWQECEDPDQVLRFQLELLGSSISDRKLRLLVCGLCRRVWYLLKDRQSRRAVEVAERFADQAAGGQELAKACQGAWDTWTKWPRIDAIGYKAICAATYAAVPFIDWGEANRVLEYTLAAEVRLVPEDARRDRCHLLRCLFSNPLRLVAAESSWLKWQERTIPKLAAAIYEDRRFEDLPILADALEEAGCGNEDIMRHCREPGAHVRGCWVVDLLLGKEVAAEPAQRS